MADVKQINGYNIKDATARTDISNLANKFTLVSALTNLTINWVGTDGQQRLEFLITFQDPNTKLLIQFTYAGALNFFVTNDNMAHWTQIWGK